MILKTSPYTVINRKNRKKKKRVDNKHGRSYNVRVLRDVQARRRLGSCGSDVATDEFANTPLQWHVQTSAEVRACERDHAPSSTVDRRQPLVGRNDPIVDNIQIIITHSVRPEICVAQTS